MSATATASPTRKVVAVTRPGWALGGLELAPSLPAVRFMEMPQIDVSSTEIRQRVASGRPIDYLVPNEVVGHIRANGLYLGGSKL